MIKKKCLYCKEDFMARDESLNFCSALHHRAASNEAYKSASKNKPKTRNRKFEPTIDESFFIKESSLRRRRKIKVDYY